MTQELTGRVFLWTVALADSEQCLNIADLIENAARSEPIASEEQARLDYFEQTTGRKFNPGQSRPGDGDVMDGYPRYLPFPFECERAGNHLRKLAIIYFMQLYKTGNPAPGSVAKNTNSAAVDARKRIERIAFPDGNDLVDFESLKVELETVRDKQIGHADGATFKVDHQANSISGRTPGASMKQCSELRSALLKLRPAAHQVLGELMRVDRI